MQAVTSVQQPCSNPSKSPEMLGKASKQKYDRLQEFCKLQKSPANYRAAFTRQRSLVRAQHRPPPRKRCLPGKTVTLRVSRCAGLVPFDDSLTTVETPTWSISSTVPSPVRRE